VAPLLSKEIKKNKSKNGNGLPSPDVTEDISHQKKKTNNTNGEEEGGGKSLVNYVMPGYWWGGNSRGGIATGK